MIDPSKACLFIPPRLSKFKLGLFERIGKTIGRVIREDFKAIAALPDDVVPVVGCTPELRPIIDEWQARGRPWIYWDRGYCRRVFATWLPRGENGGYYRWHLRSFQMQDIRPAPDDRWKAMRTDSHPWRKGGKHIVIAAPTRTYSLFHRTQNWIADTIDMLARHTDRQLIIRDKESKRSLQSDLDGAHALVTHGSIAAVESVILGCPVFVDKTSAARLVGQTDLSLIEKPVYPERQPWLNSLCYSNFNEKELTDGTLWKYLR